VAPILPYPMGARVTFLVMVIGLMR
jgi:hypothetical protein